ncbi:MAG: dipeptidyl peptidase 3, partial [Anaerolineales bacterium]|nr:dipeptidyl peptidase 3 [Anaerolineales bacterium]
MSDPFIPRRIVVTAYPKIPDALAEADSIVEFLQDKGIEAPKGSIYDENLRLRVKTGEFDLLIAIGGDGTM